MTDRKWYHPIGAMLLSYDIVASCLIQTYGSRTTEDILDAFTMAGCRIFPRLMPSYPGSQLDKFRYEGDLYRYCNFYNTFLDGAIGVPINDRPNKVWREILLASQAIDDKIYTKAADQFNLDEKRITILIDHTDWLDTLPLPIARGYFLYGVGEALVSFRDAKLIDRWYEIVKTKHAYFWAIFIVQKPTVAIITIDIPRVEYY